MSKGRGFHQKTAVPLRHASNAEVAPMQVRRRWYVDRGLATDVPGVGIEPTNPLGPGLLRPLVWSSSTRALEAKSKCAPAPRVYDAGCEEAVFRTLQHRRRHDRGAREQAPVRATSGAWSMRGAARRVGARATDPPKLICSRPDRGSRLPRHQGGGGSRRPHEPSAASPALGRATKAQARVADRVLNTCRRGVNNHRRGDRTRGPRAVVGLRDSPVGVSAKGGGAGVRRGAGVNAIG